jgi:hypothetical protein
LAHQNAYAPHVFALLHPRRQRHAAASGALM